MESPAVGINNIPLRNVGGMNSPDGEEPKGGNGKSPAQTWLQRRKDMVGINNIPLRNVDGMNSTSSTFLSSSLNMIETNVQGTCSTRDGEKPKGSLRTALKQNSPEFPDVNYEGRERPGYYSHKFDSKGNRTELSWFENLWVICCTFLCFFI